MIRFRADIEGLRAVAVLLVILNHLGFQGFRGGFIGVDVFFVISGYLITSLLAAEYEARRASGSLRGSVSILGFYLRRARRILPAALAVTVAIVVGARLLLNSLRVEQVQHDALWATLFGSNVNFIRQASNYFEAGFATSSPFRHYWSLAVEEQFYFVWPTLFLFIVGRHGLRVGGRRFGWRARLGAGLMAIGIGSFVWSVWDTGTSPTSAYFSTFTRAWELALGALIGVATTRATAISFRQALAAAWAGMAFLIAGCIVINARSAFPGYVALLPTLGAALLIVAGLTETTPLPNKILAVAPMRFVGRISYSLYLWHWPFLVFAAALYPHASAKLSTRIEILVLTFAVSTLSYYLIERPFRRLPVTIVRSRVARSMDWLERTRVAFGAAVVVSAAALGALFVVATHHSSSETHVPEAGGMPAVLSGQTQRKAPKASRPATKKANAVNSGASYDELLSRWQIKVRRSLSVGVLPTNLKPLEAHLENVAAPCDKYRLSIVEHEQECMWGEPNASHVAAITGDSHAGMWLATLKGALNPKTWSLHPFSRAWCGWAGGSENIAPEFALQNRDCAALQTQTLAELRKLHVDLLILSESGVRSEQQMLEALGRFAGVAQHVVVLGHTPEVVPNFLRCLGGDTDISSCQGHLSAKDYAKVALERRVAAIFSDPFIDTTPWFCIDLTCPPTIDQLPAFTDGSHISAELAPRLIPLLRQSLREAGVL